MCVGGEEKEKGWEGGKRAKKAEGVGGLVCLLFMSCGAAGTYADASCCSAMVCVVARMHVHMQCMSSNVCRSVCLC